MNPGWFVLIMTVVAVLSLCCTVFTMDTGPDWFTYLAMITYKISAVAIMVGLLVLVAQSIGLSVHLERS